MRGVPISEGIYIVKSIGARPKCPYLRGVPISEGPYFAGFTVCAHVHCVYARLRTEMCVCVCAMNVCVYVRRVCSLMYRSVIIRKGFMMHE